MCKVELGSSAFARSYLSSLRHCSKLLIVCLTLCLLTFSTSSESDKLLPSSSWKAVNKPECSSPTKHSATVLYPQFYIFLLECLEMKFTELGKFLKWYIVANVGPFLPKMT